MRHPNPLAPQGILKLIMPTHSQANDINVSAPNEAQHTSRVALVTGTDGGIGLAIAKRLWTDGYQLALHHLAASPAGPQPLCEQAAQAGRPCVMIGGDLADASLPERCVALALAQFGRIDLLVNNAAWDPGRMYLEQCTPELLDQMWAVNVRAPLLLSRAMLRAARARSRPGVIVNIGSIQAWHSVPGQAAYAACKGAINTLTRQLAVELGPAGIRVNAVAPGFVEVARTVEGRAPADVARMAQRTPLGRNSQPGDVAALVAFLASDEARQITGQTYVLDAGTSCVLSTHPLGDNP
jgi:NAD(P)-dependent dehydrogenase (short-subunit alcohol dehydrogenase family)